MPNLPILRVCAALLTGAALVATAVSWSEAAPSTTATPSSSTAVADIPITGLLTFSKDESTQQSTLFVHNPTTGTVTRRLTVPGFLPRATDRRERASGLRSRFTADWSMVTWASDGEVFVAHRQGDTYVARGSWKPQETFERGRLPYYSPTFNPDTGRIWFVEQADREGKTRLLSVDPLNPAVPPTQELVGSSTDRLQFDHTGKLGTPASLPLAGDWDPTSKAEIVRTPAGVLSARVHVDKGWHGMNYTCQYQPHWKTTTSLPCYTERQGGPFGSVATLTINTSTNTAALRQSVASAGDEVEQVVVSPDRRRAFIGLDEGRWAEATLDTAGSPRAVQLTDGGETAIAWTTDASR